MRKQWLTTCIGSMLLTAGLWAQGASGGAPTAMQMVMVAGGSFNMGSPGNESGRQKNETMHHVSLSSFSIAAHEVTVAAFRQFVQATGYVTTVERNGDVSAWTGSKLEKKSDASWRNPYVSQSGNDPVVCVSWYDSIEFCNWLSKKQGKTPAYTIRGESVVWNRSADGFRLPTEAEWEYAARGGTNGSALAYAGSGDPLEVAWVRTNSDARTQPVGQKKPNELGLHDMSGNVFEWCWDWVADYAPGSQKDPQGPVSGANRIVRGGSWNGPAALARSAQRLAFKPDAGGNFIGFRVVAHTGTRSSAATGMEMIRLTGGAFTMGYVKSDHYARSDETKRSIAVQSFSIGRHEVTVAEFREFIQDSGYVSMAEKSDGSGIWNQGTLLYKADGSWKNPYFAQSDRQPVVCVSWYDSIEFCNWLSLKMGKTPAYIIRGETVTWNRSADGYRLPTEAEWEYAALGGLSGHRYSTSERDAFPQESWDTSNSGGRTQYVGVKAPNIAGLFDMLGNAQEWCWDWYGSYGTDSLLNPAGPLSGTKRVFRGGSWNSDGWDLRAPARNSAVPLWRSNDLGFRVVCP